MQKIRKIKKALVYVWQLPQHLVGLVVLKAGKLYHQHTQFCKGYGIKLYIVEHCFNCAVSLGQYVIVDKERYIQDFSLEDVLHEHGHSRQSLYLGWFYLLVVGLPSILGNIWDRLFHKQWSVQRRLDWYYSRFPENWADKLGGVRR